MDAAPVDCATLVSTTEWQTSSLYTIKSSHDVKGISKDEDFVSSFSNSVCSAYAVFDGHGGKYVARNLANGVEDIPSFCQYICDRFIEFDGSVKIED